MAAANASIGMTPLPSASAANGQPEDPLTLARALRKAAWRLLPFLLLLYILAFLDRVNVGFAKQALLLDRGWGEGVYAFGSGIFFAGYAVLEVPSTLMLHRVGARAWICRIMVTWGLVCAAMMFIRSEWSFYALRFLLGVAEAGFFPGIILYLASWFPDQSRGSMLGLFYFGAPLAQVLGGPLSGFLLELNGRGGLKGWQWLFLVEGLLAAAAGAGAYRALSNRPEEAAWLSPGERRALRAALDADARDPGGSRPQTVLASLRHPRVLYLGLIYLLIQLSVYGVTFYLPANVSRLLGRQIGLTVGLVSAIPWACAGLAAYLAPRLARRTGRRRFVAAACLVASAAGIAVSSGSNPELGLIGLCVAAAGFIGAQPIFWTFPTAELSGRGAAGGLALINSLGAVGGLLAPNLKTLAEAAWASPQAGAWTLAGATLLGAALLARLAEPARGGTAPAR